MFTDVLNNLNVLFQIHLIKCVYFVWVVVFKLGNESIFRILGKASNHRGVYCEHVGTFLRGKSDSTPLAVIFF